MSLSYELRALSSVSLVACRVAAVLLPVLAGLVWFFGGLGTLLPLLEADQGAVSPLHWLGPSMVLLMAFVASGGLWSLSNAFAEFAAGVVFTPRAASAVRGFSWTLVILAILDALSRALVVALDGRSFWAELFVDIRTIGFLVVALFLAVVAQALVEGTRLTEDNQSII
ncbi:MAG: hypothetical protein RLO50_12020 [Azospirillaceae bacterium]